MKKYTETRRLSTLELRSLCIRENWYTRGDNYDYDHLFAKTRCNGMQAEITTERLAEIAQDIYDHSEIDDYDVEDVMYLVAKACDVTFREVVE